MGDNIITSNGVYTLVDLRAGIDAGASAVAAGSFFIYQMPHRAVLISYPSQSDLKTGIDAGASAVAAGSYFIYQMPHRAVLISYPAQQELEEKIFSQL